MVRAFDGLVSEVGPLAIPSDAPKDARERLTDGRYEEWLLACAGEILRSEDLVIEAGGGVGYAAMSLAEMVADVWTVEADPNYYTALRLNTRWLPNVHPLFGALTVTGKPTRNFFLSGDYRGSSLVEREDQEAIEVPAVDLESLIWQTEATALVLDVEGHEVELLATQLPKSLTRLVIEWHPSMTLNADRLRTVECLQATGWKLAPGAATRLRGSTVPIQGWQR